MTQPVGFLVTKSFLHVAYPIGGDDAFYFNPKASQHRFFHLEVSTIGSGLCERDVPSAINHPPSRSLGSRLRASCNIPPSTPSSLLWPCSLLPHGWGLHQWISLWPLRRLRSEITMTPAAGHRMVPGAVTSPTCPVHQQQNPSQDLVVVIDSLTTTSLNSSSGRSSWRFHSGNASLSS